MNRKRLPMPPLISPCRFPWLQAPGIYAYAINPFRGCAHGCAYCWSRKLQRIGSEEWAAPVPRPQFLGIPLAVEIQRACGRLKMPWRVLLSASTDFFQPDYYGYDSIAEAILKGAGRAAELLLPPYNLGEDKNRGEVWVLTKSGSGIARHLGHLVDFNVVVGVTVTSLEPTKWEPHADPPKMRLQELWLAHREGLATYISIEPWHEGTDPVAIIEASHDFCRRWIVGPLNYAKAQVDYQAGLERLRAYCEREGIAWEITDLRNQEGIYLKAKL